MPFIQPQSHDVMPFRALEHTLANGLRVIAVNTGFPNLVSIQIPVQAGSRNEVEPGKSGFAHFFEHMMFRGTERFPTEKYLEITTRTGARQNAFTTDDFTNYHITFAKDDLETILELEADRFMNLRYSEADFRTESRAVLGEYNKSASEPLTKLLEVQRDHAFTTHTYKHTTMGFIADIEDMPNQFEYSRTFFGRWYRPGFTTVIVAGDIDPEATLALVERYWGPWRGQGDAPSTTVPAEPPSREPVIAHVPWATPTLPWVTVGFRGPAFSTTDGRYAALDTVLDLFFGETSAVYRDLVEGRQLVDQLFTFGGSHHDPDLWTVFARVKQPEHAVAVRDAIFGAIRDARQAPVGPGRLADAKSNMRYSFARALDNTESIASTLARFVRFDRSYSTINDLFRTYEALTPTDLHTAATEFLTDERLVFTTLASGGLPAALTDLPALGKGAEGPSATIEHLHVASASPLLRFKLLFRVGSAYDPAGKEGLAALAAEVIASGGSRDLRIDEINKALFPIAGSFSVQVDLEMTTFTGAVHRDNAQRFLEIALPQILQPGFRDEDFGRLKEQQLNELVQDLRSNNDEELGKERLQANVFAGTPYGHPASGTVAGIEALSLEDVRDFVRDRYVTANLVLGTTGDGGSEFQEQLATALGTLPEGVRAAAPVLHSPAMKGTSIEIVKKDTRAVAISFGHAIAVLRDHEDFAALWLARAWLGDHRASAGKLFNTIREVRGLNYGDYAYIEAFPRGMYQFFPDANRARRAQLFEVWIRPVAPDHAVFALKAALHLVRGIIANGIAADEFEDTREYLMKNVFIATKTQDAQLGVTLDNHWFGLGGYVETLRTQLAALTPEAVNAAIRRHLSGTDLAVVMIAPDAEGLRQALLAPGPTTISYESPKPDTVLAEDARIGALHLGLTPGQIRITPVEDVFAR